MSWPGQGDQNWGRPGGYGDQNPYPLPGQGQYPPQAPQPTYSPPGGFGPPPPRSGGGAGAAVALVALAVVILIGGITIVVLLSRGDPKPAPPTASPGALGESSSPTPGSATPGSPAPGTSPSVRPRIAGWQGVASVNHDLAYDVPPGWQLKSPSTIVGFEDDDGKPLAAMSGAAGIERGDCTTVRSGVSGGEAPDTSASAKLSDLPGTAQYGARRWANAGYKPKNGRAPTVRLSGPTRVTLGGVTGYQVTANVTVNGRRGTCDPPSAVVYAVAFPSTKGDPVLFVCYADRGIPNATSDQDIRRVISTLRPLPA